MDFNDLKCRLITNERPTISISWFQELWWSISNLNWSAEVKHIDSSFAKSKQSFFSSCMMIWMNAWVLIVPDLSRKSNCHRWWCASTVLESWRNPCNLASIQLNYTSWWWFDQGKSKVYGENWRKSERENWRDFGT